MNRGVLLDRSGHPQRMASIEDVIREGAHDGADTGRAAFMRSALENLRLSRERGGPFEPRSSLQTWQETLITATADGPTLTAAAAASCINTNCKITLPNNFFYIGRMFKVTAQGRISCVVTTPGTARFDVRLGSVVAFDTGALGLNVVAKTTVPFWLEILLTCRAVGSGTSTNLMGIATLQSEAIVGSAVNTVGGNGSLCAPVGAPTVGTGFDNTAANTLDLFFTQTAATGSMTVHQFKVESLS